MSEPNACSRLVRKYILSIDGGGFRGLACLVLLRHLMRMLVDDPDEDPIPAPCEIFDLICGTGTGGLIAILLGRLGLNCSTAISVYKQMGPVVFGNDTGAIWGNIVQGERFSSATFKATLASLAEKYTGDKQALLRVRKSNPDVKQHKNTDTFVTVVSSDDGAAGVEAYRLRSYPTPRGGTDSVPVDHAWTICDAAFATSAAPMYFAPLKIKSHSFQDAALSGFNNPILEAIQEAELRWPNKNGVVHEFVVLSLGTGLTTLLPNKPERRGGPDASKNSHSLAGKLMDKIKNVTNASHRVQEIAEQLVAVATDTECTHLEMDRMFRKMKRQDDYFRFNPPQGLGDLDLVDYMMESTIVEITNVWLRTPDGKESTFAAFEKLQVPYETHKLM